MGQMFVPPPPPPQWWIWPRKYKKMAKIYCFSPHKGRILSRSRIRIRKNDTGSDNPKRSRTRPDTDPQHCPFLLTFSYLSYRLLFSISLWFCRMNLLSSWKKEKNRLLWLHSVSAELISSFQHYLFSNTV
jgi:hypothetical protein